MSRGITQQSAPSIGSVEWFKYVNENIAPFKPNPQPHRECKEVHSVYFNVANAVQCLANNLLNVSFGVSRVKYSIIAKCSAHNNTVKHLYLLSSSLTDSTMGCVSGVVGDMTEIQFGEFLYQTPRLFSNERLLIQLFNIEEVANASLMPHTFTGVIVLILELSNF